jgi:hypothetical protein
VGVTVTLAVGVTVPVPKGGCALGEAVALGVLVTVLVEEAVGLGVNVLVLVHVGEAVALGVGVIVGVRIGVAVAVALGVAVLVGEVAALGVRLGVQVGGTVGRGRVRGRSTKISWRYSGPLSLFAILIKAWPSTWLAM